MAEHDGYMSGYSSVNEEYDSDGPARLKLNFSELKTQASTALSRLCIRVKQMSKGSNHEIFTLFFEPKSPLEPEWSCIARLTRGDESIEKAMSEIETMRYVRKNTSIPVPDVYFYDLNPGNRVGAPFVLMERIPGRDLYHFLDELDTEHKKAVLTQLAGVLAQLASLKFNKIGSLQKDGLGPIFTEMKLQLHKYMETHKDDVCFRTPYRLIHPDFNGQNMMFVIDANGSPRLSGIIDWEYAYTGPLYYLYEYPNFIVDNELEKENYAENIVLRRHFSRALRQQFPEGSAEALAARICINPSSKSHIVNEFQAIFDDMKAGEPKEGSAANLGRGYLEDIKNGTGVPYLGRDDWKPNEELENEEDR